MSRLTDAYNYVKTHILPLVDKDTDALSTRATSGRRSRADSHVCQLVGLEIQKHSLAFVNDEDLYDPSFDGQSATGRSAHYRKVLRSYYSVEFEVAMHGDPSGETVSWAQLRDWDMMYLVDDYLHELLSGQEDEAVKTHGFRHFCSLAAMTEAEVDAEKAEDQEGLNRNEQELMRALVFRRKSHQRDPIIAGFNHVADAICRVTSDRLVSQRCKNGMDGRHAGERVLLQGKWYPGSVKVDNDMTTMLINMMEEELGDLEICTDRKTRMYPIAKLAPEKRRTLDPLYESNTYRSRPATKDKLVGEVTQIDGDAVLDKCRQRMKAAFARANSDEPFAPGSENDEKRTWRYCVEHCLDVFHDMSYPSQTDQSHAFGPKFAIARAYDCRLLVGVGRHFFVDWLVFSELTTDIFWIASAIMVDPDPSSWYLVFHLRFARTADACFGLGFGDRLESLLTFHFHVGMVLLTSVFSAVHSSSSDAANPDEDHLTYVSLWKQLLVLMGNEQCAVLLDLGGIEDDTYLRHYARI